MPKRPGWSLPWAGPRSRPDGHAEDERGKAGSSRWNMGMLNDPDANDVPGTVLLLPPPVPVEPLWPSAGTSASTLVETTHPDSPRGSSPAPEPKRTADGTVILNPQPDRSLNDPLNWPTWRRNGALLALAFYCMVGGGMTTVLAAGFTDVAKTYHVSTPPVAFTTGLYMLGLGIGAVITPPTAIRYGKRPVYLVGIICFLATAIWCAASPSYVSLLLARLVMAVAVSSCESLPSATISEMFFLHERGFRLGIYTLFLLGGKNLAPLVGAAIIQILGWRWVFWMVAIVVGLCVPLLFLFVPETFWDRTPRAARPGPDHGETKASPTASAPDLSPVDDMSIDDHRDVEKSIDFGEAGHGSGRASLFMDAAPGAVTYTAYLKTQPRRTFIQALRPWNGRLRDENWRRVAFRPFVLLTYPAVLWSTMVYALSVGWLIVLSESIASIYRADPYRFSALSTGLVYLSPFVGGVLGTAVAGKASDLIVRFMSRRNGGVYEPEFRLVMALPVALATSIGLMGYGWSAQKHDGWIVPTVFFGIIGFGCSLGITTAITFCLDSHRPYAGEALATMNFSKNVFDGLVFSLFFNRWLEHDGSKKVFVALGAVQLGCLLFTIPLYIFGKRARMWTVRRKLIERF
ncbi:MAG: hypothetical protein M1826_004645 [Phylliscum demangeonii]|nr:MAG: hypothetical protein M1826_004645 [Phylliscum demangeonii]